MNSGVLRAAAHWRSGSRQAISVAESILCFGSYFLIFVSVKVRGGSHCGWFIVCGTRSGGGGYCTSWVGVCWGCVSLLGS